MTNLISQVMEYIVQFGGVQALFVGAAGLMGGMWYQARKSDAQARPSVTAEDLVQKVMTAADTAADTAQIQRDLSEVKTMVRDMNKMITVMAAIDRR
jgi:hypothetical protein